jgi:hypothetical protein
MSRFLFVLAALSALALAYGCVQGQTQNHTQNAGNEPAPVSPPSCSDSDAGQNISVKGSVSFNNTDYPDACKDNGTAIEYYCESGVPASSELPCPSGTTCLSGACTKPPAQNATTPPIAEPCKDSDGGNDLWTSGAAEFENRTYPDSCQGQNDILEYYCESGNLKQSTKNCGAGNKCASGSCVELGRTCSDTGSNGSAAGTATQYGGGVVVQSNPDYCIDENSKLDYYCQGASIENRTLTCPEKTYCHEGACAPLCTDYDGGADAKTASFVRDTTGTYNDYCSGSNTLIEYLCLDAGSVAQSTSCSGACLGGRCYDESELKCKEYSSGAEVRLIAGATTVRNETDSCADYQTILDYRCITNRIEYLYQPCDDDEICFDADCVAITSEACYDLDASAPEGAIHVASETVETTNESVDDIKEDYCFNDYTLAEYSCSGKSSSVDFVQCEDGEKCLDGACVYPYTCTDSDGGASYSPGVATLKEGDTAILDERDACSGDYSIHEVLCTDEGRISYAILECPSGTSCDSTDGSCR